MITNLWNKLTGRQPDPAPIPLPASSPSQPQRWDQQQYQNFPASTPNYNTTQGNYAQEWRPLDDRQTDTEGRPLLAADTNNQSPPVPSHNKCWRCCCWTIVIIFAILIILVLWLAISVGPQVYSAYKGYQFVTKMIEAPELNVNTTTELGKQAWKVLG